MTAMAATLRARWDRLALRLTDALPALMIFGPVAAMAGLLTATLADLRA